MSEIDKKRIENYFEEGHSAEEEDYMANTFSQKSNIETLKTLLKEKWEQVLTDDSDTHQLNHILYKLNYQINSTEQKRSKPPLIKFISWYARIAAILLIPILIYTGIVNNRKQNPANTEGWAEMTAPLGTRIKFSLPDGSQGWLNSGSTLKYPLYFASSREVQLSGQAFFNVKHLDNSNKFVVKTKYLDVEVKGTSFDVAAYDDEDQIDVTLEQGSVLLKSTNFSTPIEMKPDEQVNYNIKTQTTTKLKVTANYFSAWKEGKLMLRNASLEELARQLSRWYNVDVNIKGDQTSEFQYRATFEDENLDEVLRLLKISSQLDYKINERVKQTDGSFSKQKITLRVKEKSKIN